MRLPIYRFYHNVVPIKQSGPKHAHVPVMAKEVIEYLKPEDGQTILDLTFGAGGHAKTILEHAPNVKLLALDRDPIAFEFAKELQQQYSTVVPLLGRFSEFPKLLKEIGIRQKSLDGIIMDLGASSMQFDSAERGFALSKDGPLDMRMEQDRNPYAPTAADVVNKTTEKELYSILKIYGEEKKARQITRAIIEARAMKKFETTKELADVVRTCLGEQIRLDKIQRPIHPATKVFQALRIFVNNELNELNYAMLLADLYLKIGGRLVALTFHSLEDTIVKRHISGHIVNDTAEQIPLKYFSYQLTRDAVDAVDHVVKTNWLPLSKHVLTPKFEEIELNPRSRSAKLRAAAKIS